METSTRNLLAGVVGLAVGSTGVVWAIDADLQFAKKVARTDGFEVGEVDI